MEIRLFGKNGIQSLVIVIGLLLVQSTGYSVFAEESLLIIRTSGKAFDDAVKGLSDELTDEFFVHQMKLTENTTSKNIAAEVASVSPKIVVLMDNKAINLYRGYQQEYSKAVPRIPVVVCMGLFLDKAITELKNATGVTYEIPIVTAVINLRQLINKPIKKLGIIHREFILDFIEENREFCKKEGVEIVAHSLPDKSNKYKSLVKKSLKKLLKLENIDALWIANDNALLTPDIIHDVWIPLTNRYKKPVVVGVETLVNPVVDMGLFAILPDHIGLGAQVAELVFSIRDNDWIVEKSEVEPPLSVIKIVNLPKAEKYFGIREEDLKNVDKILK